MSTEDVYSRVDYRRMVAWPARIEREWPFLQRVLGESGRVIDLGCGTGEHSRFLASKGLEVTGIDSSASMFEKATESPVPPNLRFVHGDIAEVGGLTSGEVDGAICLGNTLPHLEDEPLGRLLRGLRSRLRPGAPFLIQILNYQRIFERGLRFLPLNFRGDETGGGEVVFLRLMTPRPGGRVVFTPTTLRYDSGSDPAVEVVSSRNVLLRAWQLADLEPALRQAGFGRIQAFGTVADVPFVPADSTDLVIVAA